MYTHSCSSLQVPLSNQFQSVHHQQAPNLFPKPCALKQLLITLPHDPRWFNLLSAAPCKYMTASTCTLPQLREFLVFACVPCPTLVWLTTLDSLVCFHNSSGLCKGNESVHLLPFENIPACLNHLTLSFPPSKRKKKESYTLSPIRVQINWWSYNLLISKSLPVPNTIIKTDFQPVTIKALSRRS